MDRIYISRSGDGHRNLAIDEFILEQYRRGLYEGVTLYFFVNSNAVIIGRNQNAWRECDVEGMERDSVQLVRRHTGGGAVYHDEGNLNFSFITDEKHYDKERFTRVVLSACRKAGIEALVTGRNDLTLDGRKFSGIAYALRGAARGMHGTLLVSADLTKLGRYLSPSKKKLAAKGISSVRSRVMNLSESVPVTVEMMRDLIIEAFNEEFGQSEELVFCSEEEARIALLTEKQRSWEWRLGEAPVFDYSIDERFSFGELQLMLKVKKGVVSEVRAFTDSLDTDIPSELEGLLKGVRFDRNEMFCALMRGGESAREIAGYIMKENDPSADEDNEAIAPIIADALHTLHALAERSCEETRTKAFILGFLKEKTSLRVCDMGKWLYAAHDEDAEETVVIRADFDAVPVEGGAAHLCGHDGHTAALLALALKLEGKRLGRNAILLFQHAEETGAGAEECCGLFAAEGLDRSNCRIIGCHNIPGEPMGTVLLRSGAFACASCGMEISLCGAPTHAAYPENGRNPSAAVALLALKIPEYAEALSKKHSCMTLATIVGMRTGERAFGVAASEGKLWVTLRSEKGEAMDALTEYSRSYAAELAERDGLEFCAELFDVFPATENSGEVLKDIAAALDKNGIQYKYLDEPFRWSEDFGHYCRRVPSCFFGIGSGENTAPLHTAGYIYPEKLAKITAEVFYAILAPKLL